MTVKAGSVYAPKGGITQTLCLCNASTDTGAPFDFSENLQNLQRTLKLESQVG